MELPRVRFPVTARVVPVIRALVAIALSRYVAFNLPFK